MADYAWPNFPLTRFQMRVEPLTKTFSSIYSNGTQTIDLMGDCWVVSMDLAGGTGLAAGRAIEVFFDRLKGSAGRVILPDLRLLANQGTMRGAPVLGAAVAQLANMLPITTSPGATVALGDMLGAGGQLFRAMAAASADGAGNITVEVAPRVRAAIASGSAVTLYQPTAPFILTSANPALDWMPGSEYAAPSITLRESF